MELFCIIIVKCCRILTSHLPILKNQIEKWSFENADKGQFVKSWRFHGEVEHGSANLLAN